MDQCIYANKTTNLSKVEYVGFDMDATLAIYKSPATETLVFDLAKARLVELGYPKELLSMEYDASFVTRTAWFDRHSGHILMVDEDRRVARAFFGFTPISADAILALYAGQPLEMVQDRFFVLNTVFNSPETYLLAALTAVLDLTSKNRSGSLSSVATSKSGFLCKMKGGLLTFLSFDRVFKDSRATIDSLHWGNEFKASVTGNLSKYIEKDERACATMQKLRDADKKLFMLTNSGWEYANTVMSFVMGPEWRNLFQLVMVDAGKPRWFEGERRFKKINCNGGADEVKAVEVGQVYTDGSMTCLMGFFANGKDSSANVLYVGDHICADIIAAKKHANWLTMLIIPELSDDCNVDKRSKMGSILRANDTKNTYYFDMAKRYADLYTENVYNLFNQNMAEVIKEKSFPANMHRK